MWRRISNKLPRKISDKGVFILFFFVALYLSYNLNFPDYKSRGPGEIYSDKSTYYIYLPATFIYGWDIHKFPEKIDERCRGFTLHYPSGKVIIKTTYGVALLFAPFFLITHWIALIFHLKADGFSEIYQQMIILPAIFYLTLALFFLKKFLDHYFRSLHSYLVLAVVFLGTNIYFYTMDEGLMSHGNNFFLFSLFLFLLKRFLDSKSKSYRSWLLISLLLAVAILVRPTNAILLTWLVFLDAKSLKEIWKRVLFFLHPKYSLTFILATFVIFIPQFIYWKYLTGSFVYYSYPGENFANWQHPMLFPFWFAPLNGLFLYNPIGILFIAGIIIMIVKRIPNGIFTGAIFLVISYLFSSWYCWYFGGSYGCRPFSEYYALMSLPFGYCLGEWRRIRNLFLRTLLILFLVATVWYNMRLIYFYKWNTSSTWAWDDYYIYLNDAGIANFPRNSYTYVKDFENAALEQLWPTTESYHSPTQGSFLNESIIYNGKYSTRLDRLLLNHPVREITASIWANPKDTGKTGALLVCEILKPDSTIAFFKAVGMDKFMKEAGEWVKVEQVIRIPVWIDPAWTFTVYAFNPKKKRIYIDDLRVKFE